MMMKNKVYFVISFLILVGCSKNDTNDKESIIGKWQLIEYCLSDGSVGGELNDCIEVENGYTVQFYKNKEFGFIGANNNNCTTGTYTSNSTKLFLQFESDFCSNDDGLFIYVYSFVGNDLKLTPSSENPICDEACDEIFKRITIEE